MAGVLTRMELITGLVVTPGEHTGESTVSSELCVGGTMTPLDATGLFPMYQSFKREKEYWCVLLIKYFSEVICHFNLLVMHIVTKEYIFLPFICFSS